MTGNDIIYKSMIFTHINPHLMGSNHIYVTLVLLSTLYFLMFLVYTSKHVYLLYHVRTTPFIKNVVNIKYYTDHKLYGASKIKWAWDIPSFGCSKVARISRQIVIAMVARCHSFLPLQKVNTDAPN